MFQVLNEHSNYSALELFDISQSSSNSLIDIIDGFFTPDKLPNWQKEMYTKLLTHHRIRAYKFRRKAKGTNIVLYLKVQRIQFKAKELATFASLLENKRTYISNINRQILLELAKLENIN